MIAQEAVRLLGLELPDLDASLAPFRDLWVPWGDTPSVPVTPPLSPEAMPDASAPCCVIGVIDHAIPFAHPHLALEGGQTRVAAAWMMDAMVPAGTSDVGFGRVLTGLEIDALRANHASDDALYRAAGAISTFGPRRTSLLKAASHGAAVADLAAGGHANATCPVVTVSLPDAVVRDTRGTLMPSFLVLSTIFILDRAAKLSRSLGRRLPVVINTSLGVSGGPRDGTGLFERLHDALQIASDLPVGPVRMVVPMGNHAASDISGTLPPSGTMGWSIPPDDGTPSFLELHCPAGALGDLSIAPPSAAHVLVPPTLTPGRHIDLRRDGRLIARLYRAARQAADGTDWEVWTLALPPTDGSTLQAAGLPGLWKIERQGGQGQVEVQLLRDDALLGSRARPSRLVDLGLGGRIDADRCVNAYATSQGAIRVGAHAVYSGRDRHHARGPDGDVMVLVDPSKASPGVKAAGTRGGSTSRISGTSAASAVATSQEVANLLNMPNA